MKEKWLNGMGWVFLTYILLNILIWGFKCKFGEDPSTWVVVLIVVLALGIIAIMELIYHHKILIHTVKIKLFDDSTLQLFPTRKGDLIDLRAAEDVELKKGEFKLIPLGVAMKLPAGYRANVYPRSSTYKNFKIILVNSVGR